MTEAGDVIKILNRDNSHDVCLVIETEEPVLELDPLSSMVRVLKSNNEITWILMDDIVEIIQHGT